MPNAPELLHESTGLRIHRNDRNGFCVVRLHYTADSTKRSEAWKTEAAAGMSPARWAMEYEIDYTALFGERVFPEIITNRSKIVISPPYPDFGSTQVYWGGMDYGVKNPSSVHFYTIHEDILYSVWELFEPCRDVDEFVGKVKAFPYYKNVRYIAADPRILDSKSTRDRQGVPCTMNDLFVRAGLTKLILGNNDEALWIAAMRQHWSTPDDPSFKIFSCCPNLIREFEEAVFASMSEKLMATSNYRENIVDKNNHALDGCKYLVNSMPKAERRPIKIPVMVRRWLH